MFSSMDSELETHFWIWSHFQPNLYVWLKEEAESFRLQNTSWQQLNVNTDEILQMLNWRLWPEVFLTCLAVVFWGFFLQKVQEKGKWKWRPAPPRVPARSGPSGGLTAVQHVLVLGSSFTMSAICHIAPRLPGNYSSNPKWQRYLICTPAGREWTQQSQLALCWIPKSTRSLGRPGGFEHRSARADKRTIRPCFSHRPVLFLSAEETDLILKAERADKSLMVVRF